MADTQQRVALVMAASKGIGYASAEALAEGGHDLVICSRSVESLEEARQRLAATGRQVEAVQADVSSPDALEAVFEAADKRFGRLDVLVANAGGPPPGPFMRVTDEQWELAFHLTFMSAVRAMRLAVERMLPKQYGRIVIVGSSSVKQPIEGLALSNAFRPALVGAMKTLSQEVARQGVTVNVVSPGRVDTDRVRSLDRSRADASNVSYEEYRRNYEQSIPSGRYGEPREVGALIGFLGSEAAGYITGQSIIVDGGMLSALP
jgi:3-oxoacyl-[acyl-carrier protein] reductase